MAKIFFNVMERTIFENIVRMKSILSWLAHILISINGQPLDFPDKESSFGRIPHLVLFLFLPALTRFFLERGIIILIVLNTYVQSIHTACSMSQYGNPE